MVELPTGIRLLCGKIIPHSWNDKGNSDNTVLHGV